MTRSIEVDLIGADAERTDAEQPRGRCDDLLGHPRLAADADHDRPVARHVGERRDQLRFVEPLVDAPDEHPAACELVVGGVVDLLEQEGMGAWHGGTMAQARRRVQRGRGRARAPDRVGSGMADGDTFVLLCECRNVGELQLVRAALQARGVPMRIDGETLHGVLGALHGAALAPRVLVPKMWLPTARSIAAEVVGPFEDAEPEGEATRARLSLREPAGEDDDDEPAPTDDDDDDEPDEVPAERRKFVGVPLLLALVGLAIGFGHLYVRKTGIGAALLFVFLAAFAAWIAGRSAALYVMAGVYVIDVVGGVLGVIRHNRALPQHERPAIVAPMRH